MGRAYRLSHERFAELVKRYDAGEEIADLAIEAEMTHGGFYDRLKKNTTVRSQSRPLLDPHNYTVEDRGYLSPCWIWKGIKENTYAKTTIGSPTGKLTYVHRLVYSGEIPEGWTVDHLCVVPPCINPTHLEAVTNEENIRRAKMRRPTCSRGHQWTTENTYVRKDNGRRACMSCRRERTDISNALRNERRRLAREARG